jgi:hypothetical protein
MDREWLADCQRRSSFPIRSGGRTRAHRSRALLGSEHLVPLPEHPHRPNCWARSCHGRFDAALRIGRTPRPQRGRMPNLFKNKIRMRKYTTAPSFRECRTFFPMRSLCCCRLFPINRIDHTGATAGMEALEIRFFVFLRRRPNWRAFVDGQKAPVVRRAKPVGVSRKPAARSAVAAAVSPGLVTNVAS